MKQTRLNYIFSATPLNPLSGSRTSIAIICSICKTKPNKVIQIFLNYIFLLALIFSFLVEFEIYNKLSPITFLFVGVVNMYPS